MPFFGWSKTASSNATADVTINWAEGQAPSSINDSARAAMARTAEWRDDISGTITTSGTSTAFTVTSNQVFDTLAHMNGAMIAFVPHATNGATVTLNVDGLGAKPLRTAPSVEVPSGMLIQGTPYVATYNNSDAVFYLRGFYALPYTVPLGGMISYIGSTAPNSNFVIPIGQAISRTTYSALFSLVSTTYGVGDGSTTFNVPDLRGRTVFSPDSGGSARITVAGGNFDGTVLGGTGGAQNRTLTVAQLPTFTPTGTIAGQGAQTVTSVTGVATVGTTGNPTSVPVSPTLGLFSFAGDAIGGGLSHPTLPPAMMLPHILRVI